MAKRYPHFQSRPQIGKKPKLDISFNNPSNENQSSANKFFDNQLEKKNLNDGLNSSSMWDDEDDYMILLASQKVEIEQSSQRIIVEHNSSFSYDGGITFTKFGRGIESKSTQILQHTFTANAQIENEFDDDDGIFNYINDDEYRVNKQQKDKDKNVFKIPTTTAAIASTSKTLTKNSENRPPLGKINDAKNTDAKKKDTKDIQLDYMSNRLDVVRKENEKLAKDVSEFSDKLQTKDGEVSMLRHEIRNLKQLNDKLHLEKVQNNESTKKEWQDKITELEKIINAQKSELQFKNAEIHNLKFKNMNATQHNQTLDMQLNLVNQKASTTKDQTVSIAFDLNLHLLSDHNLKMLSIQKILFNIPPQIYNNTKFKKHSLNYRDDLFHKELNVLQDILAQIQTYKFTDESYIVEKFKNQISASVRKCLPELREYVRNLKYPRYRDTNASVEYKSLCELEIANSASNIDKTIFDDDLLYDEEKGLSIRRYIAVLGLLCKYNKMNSIIEDNNLLQILIESMELIGFSKELFQHFGLIESSGYLLKNLIKNDRINECIIKDYIKQLIFCRPNCRPLVQIIKCLNTLTIDDNNNNNNNCKRNNFNIINKLCSTQNNYRGILSINDYYKILQFSPKSCTLEIYGCLLEVTFDQYKILTKTQIQYLMKICYYHILLTRNCIDRKFDWILEHDNNNINNDNGQELHCNCYVRISTSFIILFHLILKQWIYNANYIDFRKISKISRIGILLLCNICKFNYRRELLQIGGIAIKNRIKIIYDWLNDHKNLLRFKSAHYNALEFIKSSHLMANPLQNVEEISDQEFSSDGDNIWSECVMNDFV